MTARGVEATAMCGKRVTLNPWSSYTCLKRMCAALRREPHFENDLPSICETLAIFRTDGRGAKARATF
eukprot:341741-Pyramimonas_sp.AAC.1